MRVVICPDKFAGTLSAVEAASAIAEGWRTVAPDDELILRPIADGGPGFVEVLHAALGGSLRAVAITDPLGRPVEGQILVVGDTAYVESAQATGLHHLSADERDPKLTTSAGLGTLITAAVKAGVQRIIIGLGGSGTNDGGAGLFAALGIAAVDTGGMPIVRAGDLGASVAVRLPGHAATATGGVRAPGQEVAGGEAAGSAGRGLGGHGVGMPITVGDPQPENGDQQGIGSPESGSGSSLAGGSGSRAGSGSSLAGGSWSGAGSGSSRAGGFGSGAGSGSSQAGGFGSGAGSGSWPLAGVEIIGASDVDNPLTGVQGASAVYGPQKGATPADVELLDKALANWAGVLERDLPGCPSGLAELSGGGAAGGLGAAILALGGRIVSGIDLIRDLTGLDQAIAGAGVVITGEGSFDHQSLRGKVIAGVAAAARDEGIPCVVLAGRVTTGRREQGAAGVTQAHSLTDHFGSTELAMSEPARGLRELAGRLASQFS